MNYLNDPRFSGIERFPQKIWLSSPTMHGDEQRWVDDAIQTNWVSTVGENIIAVEKLTAEMIGRNMPWHFLPVRLRCILPLSFAVKSSTASLRSDTEHWKARRQ